MKSLYDENGKYTPDALHFDGEASRLILPLLKKIVAEGYRPREAAHLIEDAVSVLGCELQLDADMKRVKARQAKKASPDIPYHT
ncbi:hypothetical protein LCGC14_0838800 [marine sediment metagenome]|uniref:Uncharacterized protein n=1 Tax=marine sediment metagenome TaxID=412755 RepID=A0A0F9RYF5_9ZZZZ